MPKQWRWFWDWNNEKHITLFYKLLGYASIIIYGPASIWIAIFDFTKIADRITWFLYAAYAFIMGAGIVLRKDWGKRLLLAWPVVTIVLVFALVALPEAIVQGDIILAFTFLFGFGVVLILMIFLVRYFSRDPKLKVYFDNQAQ